MAESIMLEKAKDFAVNIVNLCKHIKETKREAVLTNQLLRAGTSIGANIHESKYAHGTADFIAKMQIALKECYESEYWLELLNRTGYIPNEQYKPLHNDCGSIRRMLIASINTAKTNSCGSPKTPIAQRAVGVLLPGIRKISFNSPSFEKYLSNFILMITWQQLRDIMDKRGGMYGQNFDRGRRKTHQRSH